MLEVILKENLDKSTILNTFTENDINLCVYFKANENLRNKYYNEGLNYNKGIDFCVLVDKSISRLDEIKDAIFSLVPSMKQNDTISLVTFSVSAEVVIDKLAKDNINVILAKLDNPISYDSSKTNLVLALETTRAVFEGCSDDRIKKVMLVSGLSRRISEYEELLIEEEIKLYKKLSITLDTLAVGENINNVFLEKISSTLGGICNIVTRLTNMNISIKESLESAQSTILNNVKLKIRLSKFFRAREIYRGYPINSYLGQVYSEDEIIIDVNNIELNKKYSYYLNIVSKLPREDYEGKFKMAEIVMEYSIPSISGDEIIISTPKKVFVRFTSNECDIIKNAEVIQGLSEAKIKMYEHRAQEAKFQGNDIVVMNAYSEIIELCSELGEIDLMKSYKSLLEAYKKNGEWNEDKIRRLSEESSRTSNSPYLPMPSL